VADLILGIVVNILRHVSVEHPQRPHVVGAPPGCPGDLAVLDSAEFVVLDPEVGLDDLSGGEELENCCVSGRERGTAFS